MHHTFLLSSFRLLTVDVWVQLSWDMMRTKWLWGKLLTDHFCCPLSVIIQSLLHNSFICHQRDGHRARYWWGTPQGRAQSRRHTGMTIRWKQPTNSSWNMLRLSNNFSFCIIRDITQLCLYPTSCTNAGEV